MIFSSKRKTSDEAMELLNADRRIIVEFQIVEVENVERSVEELLK